MILKIKILFNRAGKPYLACIVKKNFLISHQIESKNKLGALLWNKMVKKRFFRDGHEHHLTVINPIEYNSEAISSVGSFVRVKLIKVGIVKKFRYISTFIVVKSSDIQNIRSRFFLQHKDLHITLGFFPFDIHEVKKR